MNLASPWSVLVNSLHYVPKYGADVRECKQETYDMILEALDRPKTVAQIMDDTSLSKAHTLLCLHELTDLGKVTGAKVGRATVWSLK